MKGSGPRAGRQQPTERAVAGERAGCSGARHGSLAGSSHGEGWWRADALLLPEVEHRLRERCAASFDGAVQVEPIMTGLSHESSLLQLADLFAGSVARKFNQHGEAQNAKAACADFFESVSGFDFVTGGPAKTDFVYIHLLT